jgi:hypothetical protein
MLLDEDASPYRELDFQVDGEETVREVPCTKLSARRSSREVTFWIAMQDHTLRKVFERRHSDGLLASELPEEWRGEVSSRPVFFESSIEYSPVLDGVIAAERFDFAPAMPLASPSRMGETPRP